MLSHTNFIAATSGNKTLLHRSKTTTVDTEHLTYTVTPAAAGPGALLRRLARPTKSANLHLKAFKWHNDRDLRTLSRADLIAAHDALTTTVAGLELALSRLDATAHLVTAAEAKAFNDLTEALDKSHVYAAGRLATLRTAMGVLATCEQCGAVPGPWFESANITWGSYSTFSTVSSASSTSTSSSSTSSSSSSSLSSLSSLDSIDEFDEPFELVDAPTITTRTLNIAYEHRPGFSPLASTTAAILMNEALTLNLFLTRRAEGHSSIETFGTLSFVSLADLRLPATPEEW